MKLSTVVGNFHIVTLNCLINIQMSFKTVYNPFYLEIEGVISNNYSIWGLILVNDKGIVVLDSIVWCYWPKYVNENGPCLCKAIIWIFIPIQHLIYSVLEVYI